jgi:hypothetical protein
MVLAKNNKGPGSSSSPMRYLKMFFKQHAHLSFIIGSLTQTVDVHRKHLLLLVHIRNISDKKKALLYLSGTLFQKWIQQPVRQQTKKPGRIKDVYFNIALPIQGQTYAYT